jgi:WD40 repeat protein
VPSIEQLLFLPDGRLAAAAGSTVRFWTAGLPEEAAGALRGHEAGIYGLAAAPDGAAVATCGGDGTLRVWDLAAQADTRVVALPALPLVVAWSPRGGLLAVGLRDGQVRLFLARRS